MNGATPSAAKEGAADCSCVGVAAGTGGAEDEREVRPREPTAAEVCEEVCMHRTHACAVGVMRLAAVCPAAVAASCAAGSGNTAALRRARNRVVIDIALVRA